MPLCNLECIVLKSRNFKDADKIFTFYSKERGKVSAIAKGVRKITSRRAGNLDTLNHVKIGVYEGNSSIGVVTEAKALKSFKNIKKSLETSNQAYYIAKLVDRFVEEEEKSIELFNLLLRVLKRLDSGQEERTINYFELNFLRILGYEMPIDKKVTAKNLDALIKRHIRDKLGSV